MPVSHTVAAIGVGLLLLTGAALVVLGPEHRRPPQPQGMVLRVELPEAQVLQSFTVARSATNPRALVVTVPRPGTGATSYVEVRFPSGAVRPISSPVLAPTPSFDLDGDGVEDAIRRPAPIRGPGFVKWPNGLVEVVSGASGAVLFSQEDPLQYEQRDRAFPVGDLDGDGCSELALIHPRRDRSKYDPAPHDALLGAKSWLTIVSGRLATGP